MKQSNADKYNNIWRLTANEAARLQTLYPNLTVYLDELQGGLTHRWFIQGKEAATLIEALDAVAQFAGVEDATDFF